MLFTTAALLPLLTLASAQYGSYNSYDSNDNSGPAPAASAVESATGAVQTVKVGESGPSFSPNKLTAAVGDKIEFHFYPATHSVAQAAFDKPCEPSSDDAFFSGGITVKPPSNSARSAISRRQDSSAHQTFTITVTDTKPIWFYCGFPGHCQKGMVGVINQAETGPKTIEAFAEAAALVDTTVAPSKVQGGVIGMSSGWGADDGNADGDDDGPSQTNSGAPPEGTSAASGLMERGRYGTAAVAGLVAGLAGIVGTLLV